LNHPIYFSQSDANKGFLSEVLVCVFGWMFWAAIHQFFCVHKKQLKKKYNSHYNKSTNEKRVMVCVINLRFLIWMARF